MAADSLARLVEHVRAASQMLLKPDLITLRAAAERNPVYKGLLEDARRAEEARLGQWLVVLMDRGQFDEPEVISILSSGPRTRAAAGHQVLEVLTQPNLSSADVYQKAVYLTTRFLHHTSRARAPDVFDRAVAETLATVFLDPLIEYLAANSDVADLTWQIMNRYRQRAEWFDKERLQSLDTERLLVLDFARYLHDWPLTFVLEAQTPENPSRLDLLVPQVVGDVRLLVEAKVHGDGRDAAHVRDGIDQAARYASQHGYPYAYLLVFNRAENSLLEFPGTTSDSSGWRATRGAQDVRIVAVNLANTLPASRSHELRRVSIELAPYP